MIVELVSVAPVICLGKVCISSTALNSDWFISTNQNTLFDPTLFDPNTLITLHGNKTEPIPMTQIYESLVNEELPRIHTLLILLYKSNTFYQ